MWKKILVASFIAASLSSGLSTANADYESGARDTYWNRRGDSAGRLLDGLYLGVEATYLAPTYSEGNANFTVWDRAVSPIQLGTSAETAESMNGAPRLTLGLAGKHRYGFQARYWSFSAFENLE